jgi:hypothetical protein
VTSGINFRKRNFAEGPSSNNELTYRGCISGRRCSFDQPLFFVDDKTSSNVSARMKLSK